MSRELHSQNGFSIDSIWKTLLSLILFFYAITEASDILIPIVFSFFVAIIINPLVKVLETRGVNSILAIFLVIILIILVLTIGVYFVSIQSRNLISDIPQLANKFKVFLDRIGVVFTDITGFSSKDQLTMLKQNTDQFISSGSSFFGDAVNATSSFITFITIVPIYVFFILLYRKNFKKFFQMIDRSEGDELVGIAKEVQGMIYSYVSGLLIVISIIAILNSTGLAILGIKYAIFMGILSAILTIIPYIGIILGALLPILVAFLTKDSLLYPLGVIVVFGIVQFLEGNFITPNIVGSKVNVNPLAAIIGLLIGGACWGIMGMILAIPILGVAQIVFRHIDKLRPYALLLSSTHQNEVEKVSVIQRLKMLFQKKPKT